jgi:hypothetical protein
MTDVCLCVVSAMSLARRVFKTVDKRLLVDLINLLWTLFCAGVADVTLASTKQETMCSILGASSAEQLEAQLKRIAGLAQIRTLPLSRAELRALGKPK